MPPSKRQDQGSALDCDRVFAILTRGPFPTGEPTDLIVESHLRRCPSCRDIAEALRPVGEHFAEPLSPDESGSLPMYDGALHADAWAVGEATLVTSDFDYRRRDRLPRFKPLRAVPAELDTGTNVLRFVCAVLGGLLLVSVLLGLGILPPREGTTTSSSRNLSPSAVSAADEASAPNSRP